jgi:hypothetical protein
MGATVLSAGVRYSCHVPRAWRFRRLPPVARQPTLLSDGRGQRYGRAFQENRKYVVDLTITITYLYKFNIDNDRARKKCIRE